MKIKKDIFRLILGLCTLFGAAACEPISPEDKAFFVEQDQMRGKKVATMRSVRDGVTVEAVLKRVKGYPAFEGEQNMEQWLVDTIYELGGEVLFPRWSARRLGSNIQEVTYEFILFNDGKMKRYQYTWDVDVLDMTVKPPVLTELEEIESADQAVQNQHLRRVSQHEQELR